MRTWEEVTDEHGEIHDPALPKHLIHDEASFQRWQLSAKAASQLSGLEQGIPEWRALAEWIFRSDIPTGPPAVEEGVWDETRHARNRIGRFIDMPDMPAPHHPPKHRAAPKPLSSPGTTPEGHFYTRKEIREAGLDNWPEKGPLAQKLLGEARDTRELYGPEEPDADPRFPQYATDRREKWTPLIADSLRGKRRPEGTPHALFMAGGSASGTTTILRNNRAELAPPSETTVHIDVDAIQDRMGQYGMTEYDELREADPPDRYAASAVHREAGDIAAVMVRDAMAAGLNVIIDGTGNSDEGDFREQLERADAAGYTVDVLYINRPTEESVALAINRAEGDGRFVPIPEVRRIHKKVSERFREEISQLKWLNSLKIYDADGPVAAMDDDGNIIAFDAERYAAFMEKADETLDVKALDELDPDAPLAEAAGKPKVPIEEWIPHKPFDSSVYLKNGPAYPQR
jgi:hypothetical protein